jgi:4-amino-4-deoxychorismate lyase
MMLINGAPAESIAATDRGLAYGDGVFRTLCAQNGEPRHWAEQYAKLAQDCAALNLPCPDQARLLSETREVARAHARSAVKIVVTRGSGVRGYAPPMPSTPTRIVVSTPHAMAPFAKTGIQVHVCRLRLGHQPALAGVKHLNRLENVLARAEWNDPAVAEGLLLDEQGLAIGGTMSNLFIVEDGTLITPILDRCGVAGVTRERVIALAAQSGWACRAEPVPLQRILDASEVFVVNSLIGLWPFVRLGRRTWAVGAVSIAMQQALEGEDAATD